MTHEVTLRAESVGDHPAIAGVVAAAFGRPEESRLVDLIRERGQALMSLVALVDDSIAGHLLVSPIQIDGADAGVWGGVAPLSVQPEYQGYGIGSALMLEMIARSKRSALAALFLLGNPDYYTRFEFQRSHIGNTYGATAAFMHLELIDGSLAGITGIAKYVEAFDEVGA